MKTLFLEVRPEAIDVGNVEDQPSPLGRGAAGFQIEDRFHPIFRAERGKISIFFPVDDLHAEFIPIEPHRDGHTGHSKGNCGNLFGYSRSPASTNCIPIPTRSCGAYFAALCFAYSSGVNLPPWT